MDLNQTLQSLHQEAEMYENSQADYPENLKRSQQVTRKLLTNSHREYSDFLSYELGHKRKLPIFYYTQAAVELGISPKVCRAHSIHRYPIEQPPRAKQLRNLLHIQVKVYCRLANFPDGETYQQALTRLSTRILDLRERNYSINRVAQHLHLPNRKIDALVSTNLVRPRNCPWELLKTLENLEATVEAENATKTIQKGEYRNSYQRTPAPKRFYIEPFAACARCGANWHTLYKSDEDPILDTPIFTCRSCGADNYIKETKQNPKSPTYHLNNITSQTRCPNCDESAQSFHYRGSPPAYPNIIVYQCSRCHAHMYQQHNTNTSAEPNPE